MRALIGISLFFVMVGLCLPAEAKGKGKGKGKGKAAEALFTVDKAAVKGGDKITVTFPKPAASTEGSKQWITVIKKTDADSGWGTWQYVPDKATTMTLATPAVPGEYEVRLHTDYPAKSYNVVFRAPLKVK